MRRLTPLFISLLVSPPSWGAEGQSHASIVEAVRHFLETQMVPEGTDYRIDINPINSQLQLAPCNGPLEAFNLSDKHSAGMLTIGVRCAGGTPWTVYTRAKVAILQPVLVLRESLPKNAIISSSHLDFAQKDIGELRGGYFTAPEQVVGKRAKRTLTAGTVLAGNLLESEKIIKRGQKVSIRLSDGMLGVQMDGTALTDGEAGQRVQIRNESSKRIVEGTAIAPGIVEVK